RLGDRVGRGTVPREPRPSRRQRCVQLLLLARDETNVCLQWLQPARRPPHASRCQRHARRRPLRFRPTRGCAHLFHGLEAQAGRKDRRAAQARVARARNTKPHARLRALAKTMALPAPSPILPLPFSLRLWPRESSKRHARMPFLLTL